MNGCQYQGGNIMTALIENAEKYKVAFYLRLSKADDNGDDDSRSIQNQLELIKGFAEENRLLDYTVYADDGWSGTTDQRPRLQDMKADITSGRINMVITKDLSRLSRNYIDSGEMIERFFPAHKVRYIALTDNFDTETDGYNCEVAMFKSMFNDMYAKDISRKITSVKRNKQKQGLFIGGKAPYGYKKSEVDKGVIEIDPEAADNVRRIFRLAKDGMSCRKIAVTLNEENIPTPARYAGIKPPEKRGIFSGKWSSERISAMLQDEVYIGNMVQGRVKSLSYKTNKPNKVPKEDWVIVENTHEPIIDRETFEKVGLLIKSRTRTRSCKYDFLLKGLIFCHECGYPLGVIKRPLAEGDTLYFACRTYQRFTNEHKCTCHCAGVEDVTQKVTEQIRAVCERFVNDIDFNKLLKKINEHIRAEKIKQGKDLETMQRQFEQLGVKIDKAYDDKLTGLISEEMFGRVFAKYSLEADDLKKKIEQLRIAQANEKPIDIDLIKSYAQKFLRAESYSRELLVSLIDRVELTENKEIIIDFKFKELTF